MKEAYNELMTRNDIINNLCVQMCNAMQQVADYLGITYLEANILIWILVMPTIVVGITLITELFALKKGKLTISIIHFFCFGFIQYLELLANYIDCYNRNWNEFGEDIIEKIYYQSQDWGGVISYADWNLYYFILTPLFITFINSIVLILLFVSKNKEDF